MCSSAVENICINRLFLEITGEDNLTVFSYSGRVKSLEWRWQRRRADLRHFEIFRYGPILIYTRLPAGEPTIRSAGSPQAMSVWSAFLPFVYGYPSSYPRAHCTPNKSVPTLRYTRRPGPIYTGPCPKALTQCSPLDSRRSSILRVYVRLLIRTSVSLSGYFITRRCICTSLDPSLSVFSSEYFSHCSARL